MGRETQDPPAQPGPGTAAWLQGLLRDRLGPDAVLGTIAFEGRLLRLDGARFPLGPSAAIHVTHAAVELGAGLPLGELPLSARLVALRCEIRAPGIRLPMAFAASDGGEDAWAHGTLRLGGPAGVEATLRVVPSGFRLDGDRLRARGRVRAPVAAGAASPAAVPLLALRIEHADAGLLALIAGAGAARIPPDLVLAGEMMVSSARAVSGSFALETPRSALRFHLAIGSDGSLLGSTLRGHFAGADAVTVGLAPGRVRPGPADVFTVDARLAGTLARPGITGRLGAARVSLETGLAALEIEGASVLLDVGPGGLAWQGLAGRCYGGSFASSGRLGRGTGELEATVAWSGVRVDAIPTRRTGEGALSGLLGGTASGEVRFERASLAEHALAARGRITVADPVYRFVRSFAPLLERYGLPPVRARGQGPLVASVRLSRGEIVVEPVVAAVDGIDVDGELRVREGGHLLGRVRVHLTESYLDRSPLLAIPAAFSGKVTIPVYLRGPPGAIEVQTDAGEILDGLIAGSRVGEAVKSVLDGLRGATRTPRRRR